MPAGTKHAGRLHGHCFRCGFKAWPDSEEEVMHCLTERTTRHGRDTLSEPARSLWHQCRSLAGDGLAYLLARGCAVPPADADLRWLPALRHPPSAMRYPALVALVTDAVTGEAMTLHRTWVRFDGEKAPVAPARMLLGGHRKAGGVIRLWPNEAVGAGLGVAEGIETALSMAHALQPVWACIDAGNLAAFPVLPGIEALTIAADNDLAGRGAADSCARRWHAAGREVRIVMAPTERTDLNDVARAAA
ncbi:MAG: toprim domain-containing protein [Rubrivivax sp.]|nr:toprim domain-containing protein [Rubrivivax sp.]